MPTPTGMPKSGEVWERAINIPGFPVEKLKFVVLERGRGDFWNLRVALYVDGSFIKVTWSETAYWFSNGWLTYIGPAGPITKRKLGLGLWK